MRKRLGILVMVASLLGSACTGIKRIERGHVPSEAVIQSYRLVGEGDKLLEEGKDHLASLKYLEAADLNPYHHVIFNKLAIVYAKLGRYQEGRRAITRSIGLDPKYPYAYNTFGIIKLAENDPSGAVKAIRKAISLSDRVPNFYVNLGHAYMHRHAFDRAREAYREALELDPKIFSGSREFVELTFIGVEKPDPERNYQMAVFFAEAGDKNSLLLYLSKALTAGFADGRRLEKESAFETFRNDEDFRRLLESYGIASASSQLVR
jgi:tetratricopeptide (TPR) repeat protein